MKIYSIDTETTGINPAKNDILTIGAVVAELIDETITITSYFNEVFYKKTLSISGGAYKINKTLLDYYFSHKMHDPDYNNINFFHADDVVIPTVDSEYYERIVSSLFENLILPNSHDDVFFAGSFDFSDVLIIGKNYDKFDREFLLNSINKHGNTDRTKMLTKLLDRTSYDIGIGCMNFSTDKKIPHTEECLKRLNIEYDKTILHHSMYDAYLMLQAFAKLHGFAIKNELETNLFNKYDIGKF
jgi:DNA polymerase III epsilon subunit-like protein